MKNLFILIIVLVGAAFVGKVVVEKRYESQLDEAISFARPFVDIRYNNIKIDFDGSISLNGLSVTPPGMDQSIDVESIKAKSSDRLLPFKGVDAFEDGKFPETFELSFRQLSLPVELAEKSRDEYFKDLPKSKECRSLNASFNYSDAGYSRIDSDLRMAFDFSDVYNAVVNIELFDQTSSMTMEWIFDANKVEDLARRRTSQLPVSEISATFEIEPDAATRFVAQCAEVFSVTPETFLEKVVGSAKYSQNSFGADLGPEMRQAMIKFMQGGSQFNVKSKPGPQLKKLEQLQFYKAKDVLRWMNLSIEFDGELLPLTASIQEEEKDDSNADTKPKYALVAASSAKSYIGRWVRIKRTNERKPLEGKLSGIDADRRLMVEMYKHGGLMTLSVGTEEIERFEVLNK